MSVPAAMRGLVLLVDDSPETLGMITEALEAAGETVLVARTGESALALVERVEPDLVLLDAVMPGLDGFETCRRLKRHARLATVPVVFMTGLSDTAHVLKGLEAGGIDYLTKPVDPDILVARVAMHVANARVIAEARLALDAAGRSVAAFSPEGRLLWSTPRAAELLGRGFGAEPSTTPAAVVEWLGRLDGRPVSGVAPLEVETGAEAVALTWLGRSATGSVLVRVGRPETGVPGRRLALALGLTPREGEVLGWLSSGKSNRDIAAILGLSPRTVNKHLEQIYAKLGVENRTAAVSLALRALEP